jgi:ABC-type branched-subunit amino acid transport system substrate-binding protein
VGLAAALALTACADLTPPAMPPAPTVLGSATTPPPLRIAILLPLSGPRAELGQSLLKAAQLALSTQGAPLLDVRDTGGDPGRAAQAAQASVAVGDSLILGPLTAGETVSVAGVAVPANMPVLAFTSDAGAASPGVWALGVTPGQQMRRLVAAVRNDGRQHIAAVLPQGSFGDALQTALADAATAAGLEPPSIERSDGTVASFDAAMKIVSHYDERRGEMEDRVKRMRESVDPEAQKQAAVLAAQPVRPPPFDALLIGDSGDVLRQDADTVAYYDVTQPQIRVLGTALWAQQVGRLGRLSGAWYAALDTAARPEFAAAYQQKYAQPAPALADIAFDAAAIARVLADAHDFSSAALTRSEGFSGVDGGLALLPDGHVRRALAVYEILPGGGARIVSPAPQDLSAPGS